MSAGAKWRQTLPRRGPPRKAAPCHHPQVCKELTGLDDYDKAETRVLPLTVDRESPYPVHWAPFDGLAHVGSEVSVTFNAAIRAAEIKTCKSNTLL